MPLAEAALDAVEVGRHVGLVPTGGQGIGEGDAIPEGAPEESGQGHAELARRRVVHGHVDAAQDLVLPGVAGQFLQQRAPLTGVGAEEQRLEGEPEGGRRIRRPDSQGTSDISPRPVTPASVWSCTTTWRDSAGSGSLGARRPISRCVRTGVSSRAVIFKGGEATTGLRRAEARRVRRSSAAPSSVPARASE